MDQIEIALQVLRDIAGGMGKASPPNTMLELGRGKFHEEFVPLLQKVAKDAIDEITKLSDK